MELQICKMVIRKFIIIIIVIVYCYTSNSEECVRIAKAGGLRTFARNFFNIDFFLKL